MKLESNFKDYYDYLTGIYGIDDKVYYKRPSNHKVKEYLNGKHLASIVPFKTAALAINDTVYIGVLDTTNRMFLWDDAIDSAEGLKNYDGKKEMGFYYSAVNIPWLKNIAGANYDEYSKSGNVKRVYYDKLGKHGSVDKLLVPQPFNDGGKITKEHGSPIVLLVGNEIFTDVSLIDVNFNKVLDAHDVYLKITEFLAYKEPEPTQREDKEKIVSAGFDVKTSFRNIGTKK